MLTAEDISFYLNMFKGLAITDIIELHALAQRRDIKGGEIDINTGSVSHKLAYIKKGLIRAYQLKHNGDDVTLMLRWENQFIASIDSLTEQKPSRFTYQTLEDTVLMEVDFQKAQTIIDKNPRLSASRNSFILRMLADAMDRIESFVLL